MAGFGSLMPTYPAVDPMAPEAYESWQDREAQAALAAIQAEKKPEPTSVYDTANAVAHFPHRMFGQLTSQPASPEADQAAMMPETFVNPLVKNTADAIGGAVKSGVTLPGDVATGKVAMVDPATGHTSETAIERAFDTASLGGASVAGTAEKVAATPRAARLAAPSELAAPYHAALEGAAPALLSDSGKPGAVIAVADHAPPFVTAAEPALERIARKNGTPEQWRNDLAKYGVTKEEMATRGLDDLKPGQPISKEELAAKLQPVEIKPVERVSAPEFKDLSKEQRADIEAQWYDRFEGDTRRRGDAPDIAEFYDDLRQNATARHPVFTDPNLSPGLPPLYSDYQLPGGTNYRERVLTLPMKRDAKGDFTGHEIGGPNFVSPHWPDPNAVVHRRSTSREMTAPFTAEEQAAVDARAAASTKLEDLRQQQAAVGREISQTAKPLERARQDQIRADMKAGKISGPEGLRQLEDVVDHPELKPLQEKMLALRDEEDALRKSLPPEPQPKKIKTLHDEEQQSDWHQAGAKGGYKGQKLTPAEEAELSSLRKQRDQDPNSLTTEQQQRFVDLEKPQAVPDGPFKDSWHRLALHDQIREAAEKGYDRISWTGGRSAPTNPKNLGRTGAEADKAEAGLVKHYDEKLVNTANKIGKAHGVQVEKSSIPHEGGMTGEEALRRMGVDKSEWDRMKDSPDFHQWREKLFEDARNKGHEIYHMDIPQSLKDQALKKGFSMFEDSGKAGGAIAALDHVQQNPKFKKWFGKSAVVDGDGKPMRLYHGTTADFDTFHPEKANIESDWGAGFYFSNKPKDVEHNYAGFGPDLTNKIERRLEHPDFEDMDPAAARAAVLKDLAPHEGATMPVYVKMEKPFEVGGKKETFLDYEGGYNPKTEEYDLPESGKLVDFIEALRTQAAHHDADPSEAINAIMEEALDGGISASKLQEILRKDENLGYATDPNTGDLASHEVIRRALQDAGFDGVIDRTVDKKFGSQRRTGQKMAGMDADTVHYIAFEPSQIKSASGNTGEFSPRHNSILRSDAGRVAAPLAAAGNVTEKKRARFGSLAPVGGK